MAYVIYKYSLGKTNEYEIKYAGRHGAKGEKRKKRAKPTPEQIKKQNQRNKEKLVCRKIKLNFDEGDYWCTLKFPRGTRLPVEEVKDIFSKFYRNLAGKYKRRGHELKWIARMEIGSRGGIHIHIIINRIPDGDKLIQSTWKSGRVNFGMLDDNVDQLAAYLVKPPKDEEEERQLGLFDISGQKKLRSYTCSRNLKEPVPEKKVYTHRTVRKILMDGPKATPGFFIDKNSIRQGINHMTGYSYLYYTEVRINPPPNRREKENAESQYIHDQ